MRSDRFRSRQLERPLSVYWASGLLILGGCFLLIPLLASLLFLGAAVFEGDRLRWLAPPTVVGAELLATAWGSWRGANWPRYALLTILAVDLMVAVVQSPAVLWSFAIIIPAALLLWSAAARTFSAVSLTRRIA